MKSTVVKVPLNLHEVVMAKPVKCLKHYYSAWVNDSKEPFEKYCKNCVFCVGEECMYREYTTEIASGNYTVHDDYDNEDKEYHYINFNCGNCGELISLRDKISYIYHHLDTETQVCKYCKTEHRVVKHDNDLYTFAIPVKEGTE